METLLTRDEFREAVFKRDGHKCVMCKKPAVDSHHIYDRKLFENGGYYLNNGASLCSEHHLEAEKCDISVEEIRTAAGITEVILAPGLKPDKIYNKWGQEIDEGIMSRKYGRTYHFNFSPGTTSDDRISHNHWEHIAKLERFILSEKLDGENNCLSEFGVFARSHATPTESRWTQDIRQKWQLMKYDLGGGIQIFLENLYAIHSIEYKKLDHHYYVFAVRQNGRCLSWEEVQFWAAAFDFPTVPVIEIIDPKQITEKQFKEFVIEQSTISSSYVSHNHVMNESGILIDNSPCSKEGVVGVNMDEYLLRDFDKNCFKFVKKGHVKSDEHWTKNWRRAKLTWENKS